MGSGVIGKFISFWIFIIAAMIFSRIAGVSDGAATVKVAVAAAVVFIVWNVFRAMGKKRRAEREWQEGGKNKNSQPVHKGQGKRKR